MEYPTGFILSSALSFDAFSIREKITNSPIFSSINGSMSAKPKCSAFRKPKLGSLVSRNSKKK